MTKPVCAIIGVGPGNGAAFAQAFAAEGYQIALLSRNEAYLASLQEQIPDSRYFLYDASDPSQAETVFPQIKDQLGPVDVLLYNAGSGVFGNVETVSAQDLEMAWRINVQGLFTAARAVIPDMRAAGKGNIVVTGATAAVKSGPNFAAFTSAKSGQRALALSMAKHLGPDKIHVSYVIVDGMVDLPRTRERVPDQGDEFFLKPADIASAVLYLTKQPQSAWTFELDVRPFGEKW